MEPRVRPVERDQHREVDGLGDGRFRRRRTCEDDKHNWRAQGERTLHSGGARGAAGRRLLELGQHLAGALGFGVVGG